MIRSILAVLVLCWSFAGAAEEDWPEFNLTERILEISLVAANLSALAYVNDTSPFEVLDEAGEVIGYELAEFESIRFYTEEPDQAILAKSGGRCYVAFRGTNIDVDDWLQNLNLGDATVYKDNDNSTEPGCEARAGFAEFLTATPVEQGIEDLAECISTCEDQDDCLVITGHSQGGAIAALASITLFSYNPIVVTFGQPPTLDPDCPYIPSERYYRYVNSMQDLDEEDDMGFDPVPYAPALVSGSAHYGYYILLSEDPANVKYLGFNNDYEFVPSLSTDAKIAAHTINAEPFAYETRIANLLGSFPNVGTDGFTAGNICEDSYMDLCFSGSCVEFQCVPSGGVQELCIKGSCEVDSDCAGDSVCIWDSCAPGGGMVQDGCPCGTSSDCSNNDCITKNLLALDFACATNGTDSGGSLQGKTSSMLKGMLVLAVTLFWVMM